VFARFSIAIGSDETAGSLRDRLAALGAHAIVEVIERIAAGTARAEPQDSAFASYAAKIDKAEARIDWRQPAEEIERRVRALNPRPVAECRWKGGVATGQPVVGETPAARHDRRVRTPRHQSRGSMRWR
jgi:methionyl-tRNA formyltransferase